MEGAWYALACIEPMDYLNPGCQVYWNDQLIDK